MYIYTYVFYIYIYMERERERERALKSTRRFPLGGALEGGPADLLFAAAGLLGGRPFERG